MDTKKEAKKYLNKYFKEQYINENDDEFKSLVRLLNKAVKNCSIPAVIKSVCPVCGDELMQQVNSTNLNCVRCGETVRQTVL